MLRRHLKVNELDCVKVKRGGGDWIEVLGCVKVKRLERQLDRSAQKSSESERVCLRESKEDGEETG